MSNFQSDTRNQSAWIIGAGKMGQALYHTWCRADMLRGGITLIDTSQQPADLQLRDADQWLSEPLPSAPQPDILLFAIKPQMMADLIPLYRQYLQRNILVLSIAAGISLDRLQELCGNPDQPIVRLMPNTPAQIGQGMTAGIANQNTTPDQRASVDQLFSATGQCLWLENEHHMHAVTALSGSGPAYVFALIEAMTDAGQTYGLPADMAARLARQTVIGSAALAAAQPDVSAAKLRENVTSPNGTTAAGLSVLQQAGSFSLNNLIRKTVIAGLKRSQELSLGIEPKLNRDNVISMSAKWLANHGITFDLEEGLTATFEGQSLLRDDQTAIIWTVSYLTAKNNVFDQVLHFITVDDTHNAVLYAITPTGYIG